MSADPVLTKIMVDLTSRCLTDINGDRRHLLSNGMPTPAYMTAHLVARHQMSPATATAFAEATGRVVGAAIQDERAKGKR